MLCTWEVCVCTCVCVFSRIQLLATPWTVARQASLFMKFSTQEYWSRLPFPTRNLLDPRIELKSPASPALTGGFFTTVPPGKPLCGTY